MGSENSKSLNCDDLIKMFNKPDVLKHICKEHNKILNKKIKGTFNGFVADENFKKNRNPDEPCFDHSRVVLRREENYGDYINASHVDGFKHPKKYIVSQAPLDETISDWWKMIWEKKCELIVMLCNLVENGKSQCYPYWSPVEGTTLEFGRLIVKTIEVCSVFENSQMTSIEVTHKDGGRLRLTDFLYKKWQEHHVSPTEQEFLYLVLVIKAYERWMATQTSDNGCRRHSNSPIVVHCNSGLARAMTFCAVDIAL